jgi:hypothetical protein
MGRRSRKRVAAPRDAGSSHGVAPPRRDGPARPPEPPRAPRLKARREEAPKAPWHPFPLVELAILAGLVLIVAAFVAGGDSRPVLLLGGLALVSVAALELAIREHFAGYRSHTTLLAAVAGLGAAAPLWWTPLRQELLIAVFVLVAVVAWRALRSTFARRSGGLSWRA